MDFLFRKEKKKKKKKKKRAYGRAQIWDFRTSENAHTNWTII